MLKIERFVTMSPEQYEIVVEGMRNPMNSWDKSDSFKTYIEDPETLNTADFNFVMGDNDEELAMKLAKGGSVHAKYRRMMPVWVTINAPLYWWKEFDTYKIGTVCNSCSTMHKIHSRAFGIDDFSHEHLNELGLIDIMYIIDSLNESRDRYLKTKDKNDWWQLIQLLPSSYNQKRTIMLNYEVLANIYTWRKDHKLDEWHVFCNWIEELPYSHLITGVLEDDTARVRDGELE